MSLISFEEIIATVILFAWVVLVAASLTKRLYGIASDRSVKREWFRIL